ncbi:MAG: hypothetical protein AAF138_02710 [Planctomycetota bacterium]
MSQEGKDAEERSVLDHIASLKAGLASGKSFDVETRQEIVEYLSAEGLGSTEIGRLVGISARQIRRDLEKIRDRNALQADPKLAERMGGELVTEARRCVGRIRRTTGDKATSPGTRVEGERAVFEILDRLTARLQSLGYLPSATQRVEANLTHHLGEALGFDAIKAEIDRISGVASAEEDTSRLRALGTLVEQTKSQLQGVGEHDVPSQSDAADSDDDGGRAE